MKRFSISFPSLPLALIVVSVALITDAYVRWHKSGPEIVVYLDKNAKQPAILPVPETTVVSGERAALWWSVFNKAMEKDDASGARFVANNAVETVYGKAK